MDGKKVTFDNYQGNFYFGTSFGISVSAPILKDNICYYRLNSFGQWYPSPSVLTARVRLSKWLEGAHPDELDATMEDSLESNKLLSYYQVNQVETISPQRDLTEEQLPDPLFSTRKFEPLDIYVSRNENRFSFYAFNRGYFPYQLKLNFSNILNLHPLITEKEYVVYPGRKQLLILDVVDRDVQNYHYDLEISEDIGDPELIAQDSFVYLTPVKKILLNGDQTTGNKHSNRFYGNFQDSIFAMRRGIITAIPGKLDDLDRIGGQNSLEILHGDGSVAVYTGIDSASITFEPGASVFSGDFLGQIDKEGFVDVQVFKIEAREKLVLMPVRFYLGYGRIGNATESIPGLLDYPEEILYRELSDRERRKKVH
ncbi:MAG: hypothetical protein KDC53_20680 [Saprospiraceae bacterium]|nr:hypothetical protein [Saprospiraceae bacterium]